MEQFVWTNCSQLLPREQFGAIRLDQLLPTAPAGAIWSHKDIQCIERVQRYFTRAIIKRAGIPYMDFDDRLANLGLQSSEYRRVFNDLVMCYKIYNGLPADIH